MKQDFSTLCAMSFTVRRVSQEKKPSALTKYGHYILRALRSVMALTKHFKHTQHQEDMKKRERKLQKTVTVLVAILIVLLLLIGTLKVIVRLKALALVMASMAGAELPKDEHGFTNILLLGEGDNDHAGVDLTDTVMIASLDPETKSAVLISIPRDTYLLHTEKMGKGRINSLYRDYKSVLKQQGTAEQDASSEALRQLNTEISVLIGLPMHGVIKVNFSGFTETIDAMGGIDITVPEDIIDTQYPGPNYSYVTFSISKGVQHLDGETALKYARSRHSTSDFSRSARQQQIIMSMAKTVKEQGLLKNVSQISDLLSILSNNVESTFSSRELLGLANLAAKIEHNSIISAQLSDQNGLFGSLVEPGGFLYAPPREEFDGAAVLLPVSIPQFPVTWKQIRTFIQLITTERSLFVHPPRIIVLNAGAKEGSARTIGGELYRYTFNVTNIRNYASGKNPTFEHAFILINPALTSDPAKASLLEQAKDTAAFLEKAMGLTVLPDPEGQAFLEEDTDIAIVLGKDFTYAPLQDILQ
jgi:LCP family protein required for cell wall assembly